MYHTFDPPEWTGRTGFYRIDYRSSPHPGETKTFSPIHLWADASGYTQPTMKLSMMANPSSSQIPPADGAYKLELLYVPPIVAAGAPPVGTVWTVPLDKTLTVEVPTFWSDDGLDSYQFSFSATVVPEPTALALVAIGAVLLRRRG